MGRPRRCLDGTKTVMDTESLETREHRFPSGPCYTAGATAIRAARDNNVPGRTRAASPSTVLHKQPSKTVMGAPDEFMKLPNANRAIVDESKVVEYLLSERHPDGRSKATFFSGFGFRVQHWPAFARALRDHGNTGEITGVSKSDYGTRYSVDGAMATPDGRNPRIRTVWIIDSEGNAPRLITAHPLRKRNA